MKPDANPAVIAWLDRQAIDTVHLTSTSLAELLVGVEILPGGRRKDGLAAAMSELISSLFGARALPFDQKAAAIYAALVSRARDRGFVISMADGQIAAFAASHCFTVATRDTSPFLAAGIPVIDPWNE